MAIDPTFGQAHTALDDMGNAVVNGANMAPDLTMRSIIAMRAVLDRHRPVDPHGVNVCAHCSALWPCPDASDVLDVLGLPDDEDDEATLY